ncbi:transposase [Aquiflexum lacus]|uniref:transposase n=1 Tax=Aquiflexum lacus TaxID=2483805 RepID=UPI001E5281A9
MKLSNQGVIADLLWYEIKNHANNVELREFVVMSNHVHGILIINGETSSGTTHDVGTGYDVGTTHALSLQPDNDVPTVGTGHALSLPDALSLQQPSEPPSQTIGQKRFQNQGKNTISSIIGSYKSAVTKHCNRLKFDFDWQSRFHDHIIRSDESFLRIATYIKNNPANWKDDTFF